MNTNRNPRSGRKALFSGKALLKIPTHPSTNPLSVRHVGVAEQARERRIDALILLAEFGETKKQRLKAAKQLLAEIRARNAARTPEQVAQIERERGLQ